MFKPNDPLNPYDPASIAAGNQGVFDRIQAGTSPAYGLASVNNDPEKFEARMAEVLEIMKADARERERTGETPEQQVLREKREWAIQDAQSASLKLEGNAAFSRGDYKEAFIIYSACAQNSGHEPVYRLNRAAVALKLKLFMSAEEDSTRVLEFSAPIAKAYFRRGCARRCLGRLDEAAEDFLSAGCLQPGDASVEVEVGEVARLKKLTEAELKSWVAEQGALGVEDVFVSREELQRLVDETTSKASK